MADTAEYDLDLGFDEVLVLRVVAVEVDGVQINEGAWSISQDATLTFTDAPTASGRVVSVSAVLLPTAVCNDLEDHLIDRWGETIAAQATFALKADKGSAVDPVAWYDPESAPLALARYREGVGDAKAEVYSSMQSGLKRSPVPVW